MKKIVFMLICSLWMFAACDTKAKTDFGKLYADKYNSFIEVLKVKDITVNKSKSKNRSIQKNKKLFFASNMIKFKNDVDNFELSYIAFKNAESKEAIQKIMLSEIGDLERIKFGENKKHIKNNPLLIIFNSNEIIKIDYACGCDKNNVEKLSNLLKKKFKTKESKLLNVGCGGPAVWE